MTEPRYQRIGFDKQSQTYELYDAYGGCVIERIEFRRLVKAVKKNTPEWMNGL